ncbi:MAG: hypothetical protein IJY88_01710 [Clostridia bacterium]|nr:hypothetical protein [Clostridia bacterium]
MNAIIIGAKIKRLRKEKGITQGRCTIVINRLKIAIFAQYCIKNPRYTLVLSRISSLSCDKTI